MNLSELIKSLTDYKLNQLQDKEILGVTSDSRKVQQGWLFVAVRGSQQDGHFFLLDATLRGAVALIVEDPHNVPAEFIGVVIRVKNGREALDRLASAFYEDPSKELFMLGVTGTNGKTSITYLIEHILNQHQVPAAVIGTIDHHFQDKKYSTSMTTPDPVALQSRLQDFKLAGAKAVTMEVSSHALDQHRVDGVHFNTVIFSNMTRDHLDYHHTMDNYFQAKQRLFQDLLWWTWKMPSFAIVNVDDPYGRRLQVAGSSILFTYGQRDSDFQWTMKQMNFDGTQFELVTSLGTHLVNLPMMGVHNIQNAVAAMAACFTAGVRLADAAASLESFAGVPGRLEKVISNSTGNEKKVHVFVDYAHTPDALERVLQTLKDIRHLQKMKSKIRVVFGCGGDRDGGKRPLMASIAEKHADQVIVTDDNPRTESAEKIFQDIKNGFQNPEKVQFEHDRRKAIAIAIQQSEDQDVILIAGKGHENYQIVGTQIIPMSDLQMAKELLP